MFRTALLLALAGAALAPAAWAGPQVPDLTVDQLPVAGTCAPIQGPHVTWLTLGEPGWFRVDEDPTDVAVDAVEAHLRQHGERAAAARAPADVWIVAAANREWSQVVQLLTLCEQSGIYRVGVQVRAESGDGIMGFPLFLPAPDTTAPTGVPKGRALKVKVVRPLPTELSPLKAPVRSDSSRLYAAATRAVESFGPIVATVSIKRDVSVQDAVRTLDLLWRAGCAGVRLPVLVMAHRQAEPYVEIYVQGRLLEAEPIEMEIPPVRPRTSPWPDHGAAQPGAYAMDLEPIPTPGETSADETLRLKPLPSYAASGQGVPAQAMQSTETTVQRWGESLGRWLTVALGPPPINLPETLLARRKRQGLGAQDFFADARSSFPEPDSASVGTVRLLAYLIQGTTPVGRVDVTMSLAGRRPTVVFGSWATEQAPADFGMPPARPTASRRASPATSASGWRERSRRRRRAEWRRSR